MKNIFLFVSLFGFATTQTSDSPEITTAQLVFRLRSLSGTNFRAIIDSSPTPSASNSAPVSPTKPCLSDVSKEEKTSSKQEIFPNDRFFFLRHSPKH